MSRTATRSRRVPAARRVRSPLDVELTALKARASAAAGALGHRLGAWAVHNFHPSRGSAVCLGCGEPLTVDVRPGPGGEQLHGQVFRRTCGELKGGDDASR